MRREKVVRVHCTDNMVTKNRKNGLPPENVKMLVLLRRSWGEVDKWEASNSAAAGLERDLGRRLWCFFMTCFEFLLCVARRWEASDALVTW